MRKWICVLLVFCLFVPALAEEELEYVEPEGDGLELTDTPESLIGAAMEIYSWFVMCPLDVDTSMPDESGALYRLLDERFCYKGDMDDLLAAYFCEDIAEELWTYGFYTVIDGVLYAPADGEFRGADERIENVSYEMTEDSETRRAYLVTVTYTDDGDGTTPEEETLEYVQDYIDERWQFTEFPFFW